MCLIQGESEVSTDQCYVSVVCDRDQVSISWLTNLVSIQMGLPILILYVFSNIVVNLLLLQLIRLTSVPTMYGCTLAGFVTSFVILAWYQVDPDNFGIINLHDGLRNWIPPSVFADVFAFLVIFAGKVLYQWDSDPKVEATTLSAEDKEVMSLLNGEDDHGLRYTWCTSPSVHYIWYLKKVKEYELPKAQKVFDRVNMYFFNSKMKWAQSCDLIMSALVH